MYVTMVRSILKYSIQISKYVHCCILSTGNSDLQKARERIKENLNNGKSIKEQLREAKKITSGIIFKCNTTHLGQTVFDACREKSNEEEGDRKAEDS